MEPLTQAPDWAVWLDASRLGVAMRQSLYTYPAVNLVHLLGLILLVGPTLLLDLRLLGLGRGAIRADMASRALTPFAAAGLILMVLTGPLMFAADAKALSGSGLMIAKLALAAIAIANALLFRRLWNDRLARWDDAPALAGRLQAALSITLWLAVAGLGRMVAYL